MKSVKSKFYIKQFNISNTSFQDWINTEWNRIKDTQSMLGYLFANNGSNDILNLYLIDKSKYKDSIPMEVFTDDWKLFLFNIVKGQTGFKAAVFKNPPIELWLDTKDNWCKKLASRLSKQYDLTFEEALSHVYMSIMKCYNKGNIYMGNLNYITHSAVNNILMEIRHNKKRINQDSGLACSLHQTIGIDSTEDCEITLLDLIAAPDELTTELDYQNALKKATQLLSQSFSQREIDQILSVTQVSHLPTNIYRRLLNWRSKHEVKEIYE